MAQALGRWQACGHCRSALLSWDSRSRSGEPGHKSGMLRFALSRLNGPVLYGDATNVVKISRIRCDNGIP
jgi:hypothetical protein